jgi:hypothetical protein
MYMKKAVKKVAKKVVARKPAPKAVAKKAEKKVVKAEVKKEMNSMEELVKMSEKNTAALEAIAESLTALVESLAAIMGDEAPAKPKAGKPAKEEEAEEPEEKPKKGAKEEKEVELTEEQLEAMDKEQLVELAEQLEIKSPEKMKEKELRAEIIAAAEEAGGDDKPAKGKEKSETKEEKTDFEEGDEVLALYPDSDDEWYKATYVKALKGGKAHKVTWDDGDDNEEPVSAVKARK